MEPSISSFPSMGADVKLLKEKSVCRVGGKVYSRLFLAVLVTLSLTLPAWAQAAIISTVAGNGSATGLSNPLGDGDQATSASLNRPAGVFIDALGNYLYLADSSNNRIRKVSLVTGIITTFAGPGVSTNIGDNGQATDAYLKGPYGVAMDASENLYVAEMGNNRIRRVDSATGVITTVAGPGVSTNLGDGGPATNAYLKSPTNVALDRAGNLYIADMGNNRIRRIDVITGIITTVAGPGISTNLGDGGQAIFAYLKGPSAVVLDRDDNLYIAENTGNRIRRVDSATGIITTVAGSVTGLAGTTGDNGPATAALLKGPAAIALGSDSHLYVADSGSSRIRLIDFGTGIITTVAGTGTAGTAADGVEATQSPLNVPSGVALDGAGNLYIGDYSNHRVRRVSNTQAPPLPNNGPTVNLAIADQVAAEGSAFSFTFAVDTFEDIDAGDSLSYTATLTDGSSLPGWLTFAAASRTFSGTPGSGDPGSFDVNVTATDNSDASAADIFRITVNSAPPLLPFCVIAAGGNHSAAIKPDGSLWGWGSNGNGQVGDGSNTTVFTLTRIGTGTDWAKLALGDYHSVALKTDGSLWAWGRNFEGELGNGTTVSEFSPVRTGNADGNGLGDTDWKVVAAGNYHTLAIKNDGTLWVWGGNLFGQLGDGTKENRLHPIRVGSAVDWKTVAAGFGFSLAQKNDGSLWVWGDNSFGQLGDGSTTQRLQPVRVGSGVSWQAISAGMNHALALDVDGQIWGWGRNDFGQLGNGTSDSRLLPVKIGDADGDGSPDTDWAVVEAGNNFTTAIKTDGTLWVWGANDVGQLGDGNGGLGVFTTSPVRVGFDSDWVAVATGAAHVVALKADGRLLAWGNNAGGQLGDGTTTVATAPLEILDDLFSYTLTMATVDPFLTPTSQSSQTFTGTIDAGLSLEVSVDTSATVGNVNYPSPGVWECTIEGLSAGENRIRLVAVDDAGNVSDPVDITVIYDATPPAVNVSGPYPVYTRQSSFPISGTFADNVATGTVDVFIAPLSATVGEVMVSEGNWICTIGNLQEGSNEVTVVHTDKAGNQKEVTVVIVRDTVAPTVTIDLPTSPIKVNYQTIGGTIDGDGTVSVNVDTGATAVTVSYDRAAGRWSANLTGLRAGNNGVTVTAADPAGNVSLPATAEIFHDVTPPSVTIVIPEADGIYQTPVLNYTVSDDYPAASAAVQVFVDDTIVPAASGDSLTGLDDGAHVLRVVAIDAAGNERTEVISFTVDTVKPELTLDMVSLLTSSSTQLIGGSVETGTMVGVSTSTTASGGAALVMNGLWRYEIMDLESGDNIVTVTATDTAGNQTTNTFIIVLDTEPPATPAVTSAALTNSPTPTWSWSGGGGGNGTFRYKLDDADLTAGATETTGTSFTPEVAQGDGLHTLYVQERDAAGNWSDSGSFAIQVDMTAPMVTIDSYSSSTSFANQVIGGRREAGLTVTVTGGDAMVGPVSYPTQTSWSSLLTGLDQGKKKSVIVVTATDAAGNIGRATQFLENYPTAPLLTFDVLASPTNLASQTIGGRRTPGTEVWGTVSLENELTMQFLEIVYPSPETWSCSLPPLTPGTHIVKLTSANTDVTPLNSAHVSRSIVYDPAAPTLSVDTLISPTNRGSQVIGGSLGGADVGIAVLVDSVATAEFFNYLTADSWSCAISGLVEGDNNVTVTATDAAGNVAQVFRNIFLDMTGPAVTINSVLSPTTLPSQTIRGTREAGADISIWVDTTAILGEVVYPTAESWECGLYGLLDGDNNVIVTATDAAGNTAVSTDNIVLDTTGPTVTILTPEMGKRYRAPVLNYTLSDDYAAQPPTAVASIVGGGTVANGDSLTGLVDGEYHLQVVATDAAGNETMAEVVFTVDTVPPALTVDEVTSPTGSQAQTISGAAEAGATVSITTDTAASDGEVVAVSDGSWSYEITGLEVGENVVSVVATDAAGNPSEPVVATLTRIAVADQIVEDVGHLAIDGTAKSFYTATSRQNPVVIVGPPTLHDATAGVVRLSAVTGSGFAIRFQRWGADDQAHPGESVSYLVLEEGLYAMADGSLWEVGSFSLSGTQQYTRQTFSQAFAAPPALFLTVQTANEADAVSVRLRNVTAGTFEAALFEEEAKNSGHAAEKIGYLAVYSPQGSGVAQLSQAALPFQLQQRSIGSALMPVLSSSLKLEEETSADAETVHAAETVSVLALGSCLFAQVTSDNETDTVALRRKAPEDAAAIEWGALVLSDNAWVTVPLVKGYGDPVAVVKPASGNNAEPGYVQVRNVTTTSFEVRYDEWADAWDASRRQPVQVFYLVADRGEQSVGGLAVAAGKLTDSSARYPSWQNVAFTSGFTAGPPAVFTSVQTAAGSPVVTRVQNVTSFGFEMTMQGAEADSDGAGKETLGWIAVAKGGGVTEDGRILTVFGTAVGSAPTSVNFADHYPRSLSVDSLSDRFAERYRNLSKTLGLEDYLHSFAYVNPVLVGDLNTSREVDTASLVYRNLGNGGVELLVQEEKSLDAEMQHAAEEVSVFVAE